MKKTIVTLIISLILVVAALFYQKEELSALEGENLILKTHADSLILINDSTARALTLEILREKDLRALAEKKLNVTEKELAGTVRSLTSLGLELKRLRALLEADTIIDVDTVDGRAFLTFERVYEDFAGYSVGVLPVLNAPKELVAFRDSLKITAEVDVNIDTIYVSVAMTETNFGIWETYVHVNSPLFKDFGDVQTSVFPKRETLRDRLSLCVGAGMFEHGFLKFGVCYDSYGVSYIISSAITGMEINANFTLAEILNMWGY